MGVAVCAHVREGPARDLNLVRDRVQSQERAERRRVELWRMFPLREDLMAGAEFADVMIPNVLLESLELTAEILLGFLPVKGALTAWDRVPRKLRMVFVRAELRGHSRSRGEPVRCLALCVPVEIRDGRCFQFLLAFAVGFPCLRDGKKRELSSSGVVA